MGIGSEETEREKRREEKRQTGAVQAAGLRGGGGIYREREPAVRAEKKARPIGACAM
jgi:hypothetical protein